jgi:hypothetical protein
VNGRGGSVANIKVIDVRPRLVFDIFIPLGALVSLLSLSIPLLDER